MKGGFQGSFPGVKPVASGQCEEQLAPNLNKQARGLDTGHPSDTHSTKAIPFQPSCSSSGNIKKRHGVFVALLSRYLEFGHSLA